MFVPEAAPPKPKRIKIRVGLFLLLLFLMPFDDWSCGRDFAIGFPLYLVSVEEKQPPTVWQPVQTGNIFRDLGITAGINFGVMIFLWILLRLWFRSQYFQKRARQFALSNVICFITTLTMVIVGYVLIGFFMLQRELPVMVEDILYQIYVDPMLYFGGIVVLPIAQQIGEYSPLSLMWIALPVALFNMYWVGFVMVVCVQWIFRKRKPKVVKDS